jgi:NADH-quinone oxidoreductase subunit E
MDAELARTLEPYRGQKGALITVLQKIQEKLGYLPKDLFIDVARLCRISINEVYGVASFYAQFRFTAPGRHGVKVCLGTACHVRGGQRILESVERDVGVSSGGTSSDGRYSLERVACFGSCALAPVVVVDKDVYGRMTPAKAKDVLSKYE